MNWITFATILFAALALFVVMRDVVRLETRVEELELVILNSRIEWEGEE